MKQYIYTDRNGIHILNLQQTMLLAKNAYEAIRELVAQGKHVLFVGTKKQAQAEIKKYAEKCGMPYVNHRWLGGLLTNFKTVKQSILRLRKLEEAFENNTTNEMAKTKKETLMLERELMRLKQNFNGIKDLNEIPAAIFIVDPAKEAIALQEANKLGMTTFGLVDTNCNPELLQYPIPANDDAIRSIALFLEIMYNAIMEGKKGDSFQDIQLTQDGDLDIEGVSQENLVEKLNDIEELEEKYEGVTTQ